MPRNPEESKAQLLERVCQLLKQRLAPTLAPLAERFTRQYYAWLAADDFLSSSVEDLYGAALSHFNLARQRQPGQSSVRVYNPNLDEHGWQSSHSIVEIVNDDMPFLVDSVTMELNRRGLTVHRIIHPVLKVVRDAQGQLRDLPPTEQESNGAQFESIMHFAVDRHPAASLEALQQAVCRVLTDVRAAVSDWLAMRSRLQEEINNLDATRLPIAEEEVREIEAFLTWVCDEHFTFLGCRDYALQGSGDECQLLSVPDSGLGILRNEQNNAHASTSFAQMPAALRSLASSNQQLLIITKANARSTVHRPVALDYIGLKRFDDNGHVIGERRFLGLYTSAAYYSSPREIPLLRRKINRVLTRSGLPRHGHAGKALLSILETFPRDDLFQASEDELYQTSTGILQLQERQRLRLFIRHDPYGRFASCLVYVPRERYNTELRTRIQSHLARALGGEALEFTPQFMESMLMRIHYLIRTKPGQVPEYSVAELEAQLYEVLQSWTDELQKALLESVGEEQGNQLWRRYGSAFPAAYREEFTARIAVRDCLRLEQILSGSRLQLHLYRPPEDPEGLLRFKLYGPDSPLALSEVLPILERMGLQVRSARPYELLTDQQQALWILDFDLHPDSGLSLEVNTLRPLFEEAFARIWDGRMENDGFNRLVLSAGLAWQDVVVLRAYCKYLLQIRVLFSQSYMEDTLARYPAIVRQLLALFHVRFDLQCEQREAQQASLLAELQRALEQVANLDEDRILRHFLNLIRASVRTNLHQQPAREYLALKFDPALIDGLPLPKPMFEIFVYSPRVEAVHLRGGRVARGGLRWSDRREDFRTEVLGLVKAQMVKNAVIVPVGSKGGFVLKRAPSERQALQAEGIACYQIMIRGLLDLTDNLRDGQVIAPPNVVRHDGDDPYLVVAADKGTASFSDIANAISREYGFWLGDAFASGGSAGYDHKKMGITARGAWESIKHHFRQLGKDIQRQPFTVVGIGDMSGDVFGNGMLLSQQIGLVAAFDHRHIFLDPHPDPALSWAERQRLFNLPRSSWQDYNSELISVGGGIWPRSAKSIPLSAEVRALLQVHAEQLPPNELIRAILRAPVELLYNGGIGTYVKASSETHAEVGDRTNDGLRIDGRELRCLVVGEGGNLGFTQRGRIEYARQGGRIYTDAIDNSGGVNCSDHEVNIKILLGQVVAAGDLTEKQRNQLLAEMTAEVAQLVLRQNYQQPLALNLSLAEGVEALSEHVRVLRTLERSGRLNRALEFLPDDEELAAREQAQQGLCAPEIAVLLAYSKITLFEQLIQSDVPEDPYLKRELQTYFPSALRERYQTWMDQHPLKREIIATFITNSVLNRMGSSFIFRLSEETGLAAADIARAYAVAREVCDARQLWAAIEALDNQVPASVQLQMLLASRQLLSRATVWLLRHRRAPLEIETTVSQFHDGLRRLRQHLVQLLQPSQALLFQQLCQSYQAQGVPDELARWLSGLSILYSGFDLVEVSEHFQLPVEEVAQVYFALAEQLDLNWLRQSIQQLPAANHWQDRARSALLGSLYETGRLLAAEVLRQAPEVAPSERLALWMQFNQLRIERFRALLSDLRSGSAQVDLAVLSVALREVGNLV